MSINRVSAGYYPTGYTNNKTSKAEAGKTFAEIVNQKSAEAETGGFFGVGGFWISNDGKECQITKMFVDRFVRWYNGDVNQDDMLGNSVQSAMSAVEKWIYDLDHPLAGQSSRSIEDQRLVEMERKFYESFLDKLMHLTR